MARARVLDVGNCTPDHTAIRGMLRTHFDVDVERRMFVAEAVEALRRGSYDLVLVNRRIFEDGSDGMDLVRAVAADPALRSPPIMLVSNFPEAQAAAVSAGARPGFGKAALDAPQTLARLGEVLPARTGTAAAEAG